MSDDVGARALRDILNLAPDGRRIFIWTGQDRAKDVAALTEAIAASTKLYNHDGALVRLVEGRLLPVNRAALLDLIGQHICGLRLVMRDGRWQEDYYPLAFNPMPHPGPPRPEDCGKVPERSREPDAVVLDEIYQRALPECLPRVQ
jgi:hypothetical protein